MKKITILLLLAVLLLTGCGQKDDDAAVQQTAKHNELDEDQTGGEIIEIKERLFIAQTNDIYLNTNKYLGKTIKYEALYKEYFWEETNTLYRYAIRYGPGCCGTDGDAGFEIEWDGDYPEPDDWIEVVGVLEEYEEDGGTYLRLRLTSLNVLDERGAEYVET